MAHISDIFKQKKELRKAIKVALKSLTQEAINAQSEAVFNKLKRLPQYTAANRVSVYISMGGEVNTDSIILDLLNRGVSTFVPQFKKGSTDMAMLKLRSVEDYRALPEFMWGIRQPAFGEERENAMDCGLDLIIMPGVAFTRSGKRLGHGGSFYDTFLHNCKAKFGSYPYTVALALDEQVVTDVPFTDRDVDLDCVLSMTD